MSAFSGENSLTLPEELDQIYEVQSCLKYDKRSSTCLLKKKTTGQLFLLKTASDPICTELLYNEKEILDCIHSTDDTWTGDSFPRSVYLESHSGMTYYIRTYIEGYTLEELCETRCRKPALEPTRAMDYVIALTELLHFLHTLNPPLIHRDIKPQNVVVDAEGGCHFIDLGISRFFHGEKDSDTYIMGTKLTAPPEQFGYHQTDIRSDLYSLGILLLYCVTGEYDISDRNLAELSPNLQQIIHKATMFDPNKRYQTSDELLTDLLAARYPTILRNNQQAKPNKFLTARISTGILAALCIVLTVLLWSEWRNSPGNRIDNQTANREFETNSPTENREIGTDNLTENKPIETAYPSPNSQPESGNSAAITDKNSSVESGHIVKASTYTFAESLIETAVRQVLNIPEGEPITYGDLERVTELHLFGELLYSNDSQIWLRGDYPAPYDPTLNISGIDVQKGNISTLKDITVMPNLRVLSLYNQQITDISALKDTKIAELGLGYNPLTDLSPLQGNETISYLSVPSLRISDLSVIASLPNLKSLNISGTDIYSLEELFGHSIETLNLFDVELPDYSQLQMLPDLHDLEIFRVSLDVLNQLEGIPLKNLIIGYSNIETLEYLNMFPELETLFWGGDDNIPFTFEGLALSKLRSIDLRGSIANFNGTASLTSLISLNIQNAHVESFDGLDQIPHLREISWGEEQRDAIFEQYPDNHYICN